MNSKPSKEEQPKSPRKGLVFRPSRRTKRQNDDEMREETTPVSTVESPSEQDRSFKYPSQPSRQLQLEPGARGNELPERTVVRLTQPPSAREAAFSGPPRFDWIDVVRRSLRMRPSQVDSIPLCKTSGSFSFHFVDAASDDIHTQIAIIAFYFCHSFVGNGGRHQNTNGLSSEQGHGRPGATGLLHSRHSQPLPPPEGCPRAQLHGSQ